MNEPTLRIGRALDGKLVTLQFDHGRANEMGSAQITELEALAAALYADPVAVALVSFSRRVSSKGNPIFVAGANVTERAAWDHERTKAHVTWQRAVLQQVRRLPLFHIAIVNGVALGWGTEWLLTADWRIATPGAVFGLPETGLGILPGAGGSAELWHHVGVPQALRLGMTGERIGADEAHRIGLVQEVLPDVDAGLKRAHELAERVSRNSPTAVAAFKGVVLAAVGSPYAERTNLEAKAYASCVDSGDADIGRAGFSVISQGGNVQWGPRRAR